MARGACRDRQGSVPVMDDIERVATVLGTLASGTVWVIGLAMLALMAAQPLLEAFAQSRVDGDVR